MRTSAQGCTVQVHLWDGNPHGTRVLSRAGWDGYLSRFRDEEVDAARALDKVWDRTSAVVLLGQVGNGRVLVRISHANSPEKHLETWGGSGQWSRMFVLGRESAFSQVIARQCAIGLIQRVRGHEQAEV